MRERSSAMRLGDERLEGEELFRRACGLGIRKVVGENGKYRMSQVGWRKILDCIDGCGIHWRLYSNSGEHRELSWICSSSFLLPVSSIFPSTRNTMKIKFRTVLLVFLFIKLCVLFTGIIRSRSKFISFSVLQETIESLSSDDHPLIYNTKDIYYFDLLLAIISSLSIVVSSLLIVFFAIGHNRIRKPYMIVAFAINFIFIAPFFFSGELSETLKNGPCFQVYTSLSMITGVLSYHRKWKRVLLKSTSLSRSFGKWTPLEMSQFWFQRKRWEPF